MRNKGALSAKEKLFCSYYCALKNGEEAAAKSGFKHPQKAAVKLLADENVKRHIKKLQKGNTAQNEDLISGYWRLAFGCVSDAVSLVFEDELDFSRLSQMDLFNISEIKRARGGGVEVKFFDRLKALDKLSELTLAARQENGDSLEKIIEKSARRLKKD